MLPLSSNVLQVHTTVDTVSGGSKTAREKNPPNHRRTDRSVTAGGLKHRTSDVLTGVVAAQAWQQLRGRILR